MSTRTLHSKAVALGPLVWAVAFAPSIIACGAVADRSPNEPDCRAEDAYEFSTPLLDAEQNSVYHPTSWFGSSDNTPGCQANPPGVVDGAPVGNVTLDDAGLPTIDASVCTIRESTVPWIIAPDDPDYPTTDTPVHRSLVFHSTGCTYWGSNASHTPPGTPNTTPICAGYTDPTTLQQPTGYWNGSAFEGIAFWARTPGQSNHSVYITLNNADTAVQGPQGSCNLQRVPGSRCTPAPTDATAGLGLAVVDSQSGTATSGGVPARIPEQGECGNAFQLALTTTPDWQFYTMPFDSFWQLPYPNRIASGFDAATTIQISVIFPKEVRTELWITNFRFYRQKGAHADGGAN